MKECTQCNFLFYVENERNDPWCFVGVQELLRLGLFEFIIWFLEKRKALKMEMFKFVCIPCSAASNEVRSKEEIINNFLKFSSLEKVCSKIT